CRGCRDEPAGPPVGPVPERAADAAGIRDCRVPRLGARTHGGSRRGSGMTKALGTKLRPIPNEWDRRGLPGWTYHSKALFDLEKEEVFRTHWQIVGHVNDVPAPGDYLTMD